MMIGDLAIWNELAYKRKSRQLDLLARGDYSPIQDELTAAYPNTDLPVRAIPFVQRYVAELSGMYARSVVRRFKGSNIPAEVWQKLQAVYDASRIDHEMRGAEQSLWTQNTYMALVLPDGIGKVKIIPVQPWQLDEVEIDDPLDADDVEAWSRVLVRVPAQVTAGSVLYGQMELTRTHAWRQVNGKKAGIYNANGSHPFGVVPLVVAHRVEADPGRATPPVNEAVLNLQIALSLQQADNELIVRHCAWPQKVIENADVGQLVEDLSHGPDKFLALVRSGDPQAPGPKLSVVQGQVPVAELVSFAEHQIRLYCAMLGLDPSAFLRVNTAVTVSARLFAAQDRQALRDRILPTLAELEQSMLERIIAVLALRDPMPIAADLTVEVTYQPADPSPDRQADAQALQAEVALGISSPVDVVAARDGVGRSEALRTVKRNLQEGKDLGLTQSAQPDPAPMPEPDIPDPMPQAVA
jgi:hypothetical protein